MHYAMKNAAHYNLAYATHSANAGIVALIEKWHKAEQMIYLVGHSWSKK